MTGRWRALLVPLVPLAVLGTVARSSRADDAPFSRATRARTDSSAGGGREMTDHESFIGGIRSFGLTYAMGAPAMSPRARVDQRIFVRAPALGKASVGVCRRAMWHSCDPATTNDAYGGDRPDPILNGLLFLDALLHSGSGLASPSTAVVARLNVRVLPASIGSGYGLLATARF